MSYLIFKFETFIIVLDVLCSKSYDFVLVFYYVFNLDMIYRYFFYKYIQNLKIINAVKDEAQVF